MINVYLVLLIVLGVLVAITILTSIYINRYNNSDVVIATYIAFVTISQFLATRITIFDFGGSLVFATTAASIIFPFTFQLTDQVNEFFGRRETQKMIFIAFFTQIFIVIFSWLAVNMSQVNDNFDAESFNSIFFSSIRITFASWIAFLISENFDAYLYQRIKKLTKNRFLWMRNIVSDIFSLFIDSLIFVPIAFLGILPLFGVFSIFTVFIGQVTVKWVFGLTDTPTIYLSRFLMFRK